VIAVGFVRFLPQFLLRGGHVIRPQLLESGLCHRIVCSGPEISVAPASSAVSLVGILCQRTPHIRLPVSRVATFSFSVPNVPFCQLATYIPETPNQHSHGWIFVRLNAGNLTGYDRKSKHELN
jgi:hypothetical protein